MIETENFAGRLDAIFTGVAQQRWEGKAPSAIVKSSVDGPQQLLFDGFTSDQQADLKVHGGVDKAVHHYPAEHYIFWQNELPELADKFRPGGFGENLTTVGFRENNVCIGDIFELGSSRIQISQGRQPCWKLNMHVGSKKMVLRFQETGFTGWYYRVLKEGIVNAGDKLILAKRPNPEWSLERVISARFDVKLDPKIAAEIAALPELAESWREAFIKKSRGKNSDSFNTRVHV